MEKGLVRLTRIREVLDFNLTGTGYCEGFISTWSSPLTWATTASSHNFLNKFTSLTLHNQHS